MGTPLDSARHFLIPTGRGTFLMALQIVGDIGAESRSQVSHLFFWRHLVYLPLYPQLYSHPYPSFFFLQQKLL